MGLKAIFIDMGGTIETFRFTRQHRIENCHVIRDCLATKGISLPIDDEQLADMISKNISTYSRWSMTTNIELSSAEIWSNYILKDFSIGKETIEDIAENLAFLYETRLYIREMRPEVPYVLQKIKDMGLTIGCISNTQSITQVPYSMKSYGIYDFFEHIILSSTYGRRKPDPAIFYYAARLANLPTGSCAYIGDKINRDILGSNRAGYSLAVQIRHQYDNGDIDEGATPDAVINSMDELIPILESRIEEKHSFALNTNKSGIRALLFDAGDILYFRPNKGAHFNKFLSEVSVDPVADIENELLKYRHLAFTGQIKRHAYYEKVIRLQGIHDPVLVEKGIKALSLDDNTAVGI